MSDSNVSEPEERLITSSHDLDDYDIISTNLMSVAVPHRTNEGFRKMIWAAMVTYSLGNNSVDHVMKRYKFLWARRQNKSFQSDVRVISLRETCDAVREIADQLEKVKSTSLGKICAKSALCRLEASFKAAYGLVRRHYVFETEAVIRMILEQLAWAYVVPTIPEDKISKLKPNDCITRFKTFFADCGKLNGMLSNGAHIDPSIVDDYATFHAQGIPPVRRSREDSFDRGDSILVLAIVYLRLSQASFDLMSDELYTSKIDRLMHLLSEYRRRQDQHSEAQAGDSNDE